MSDVLNFEIEELKISESLDEGVSSDTKIFFSNYAKFYPSTYMCPKCNEHLYKINFEVNKEYPIFVNKGRSCIGMKRVFTCMKSKKFYTIAIDKLSDGQVYSYTCKSLKEYKAILDKFNWYGTSKGRPDGGFADLF